MSKYDAERKKLGIKTSSTSTAVAEKKKSKYDKEREAVFSQKKDTPILNEPTAYDPTQYKPQQLQSPAHTNVPKGAEPVSNYDSRKNLPSRKIPIVGKLLKTLDKLSDTKAQHVIADIGQTLYTPGGTAANIAGFTGAVGRKLAEKAPNLAGSVAGRVAQTGIKEGSVGVPLGVGQYQAQGGDDTKEALKAGAVGALLGGGLGALGGSVGEVISKVKTGRATKAFEKSLPVYEQAAKNRNVRSSGEISKATPEFVDNFNNPKTQISTKSDVLPTNQPDIIVPVSKYAAEREAIKQTEPTKVEPINITDTENVTVKPSPVVPPKTELQSKLDELEKDYQTKKSLIASGGLHAVDKSKSLKGLAMDHSAKKRTLIQGNSLIPVDGGFTEKELSNKIAKLKTNYSGKEVVVNGMDGVITKNSFGKVGVRFEDGTEKFFMPDQINAKTNVDDLIKQQIAAKVEPIAQPTVETVAQPIVNNIEPTPISKYTKERAKTAETTPTGEKERGFVTTLKASEKPPQGFKERVKASYTPITNQRSVDLANKRVKDLEEAASYVMGKSKFSDEKVTTAHRLIDEFSKSGNHQRAVDIAESIAEEGTRAGQGIQAFSIYNRLTPEGVLIHAQRIATKTNEGLNILQKEVKLTPDMAAQLTDLAHTTKAMTGVKDLSNNVMDILERAKSGTKLNAEDSEALLKFVNESKQFIKEVEKKPTIKPPTVIKEKRIKDNVIKFLDKQEEAAKERIRARGHRISSTPIDIYADYAIIGAAKMARGTIKFSEWSAAMIKDLGEEIRPLLENIYNKAAETMNQSAKKVTKSSVSNAERIVNNLIKNNKISGEDAEQIKILAEKVSNLSGDAKNVASQDLQFILRQLEKPTMLKKVSSTQTIAQLLNSKTLVRNALGNELFYRLERINKYVTTPIDWGRVKLFGGQRSVTFRTNNQGEYWSNWLKGLKAGWRGVNVEGLQTQFDLGPAAFNGKWNPLTYMEKALGASLKSFDTAAYKRAVNDTIGEMATLRAMNEGLTGEAKKAAIQKYIRNVDDHVLKISDDYGKYMTFQDNNLLSKGLVGLKRGLNFGKDFGIGDLVLKYPKTPGALLMRALEYSPAGFLRSASIAAKPFFKREPNTAEAMQALSRAIVGTAGLSGLGFFLADVGILTGAASKDKDIRDLQRSAGQGQYQVNLSALRRWAMSGFDPKEAKLQESDYLYTYDWAQPVAMAVSVGANVNQNLSEGKGASSGIGGTIYSSIEGGVNSLVETSVLSGVKRAFTSYPGQSVTDKITDIVSSAPASFVPTAVNQAKQLMDNAQRETYDPSKLQQAFNQLKVKIPGVAGKLPQRYDTLGEKKVTYQNNSLFNVLLNPGFTSKYKLTPEAKMVVDLIAATGDTSVAPRVPGKSITVYTDNGEPSTQKLTTEQFTELQRLTGEETVRLLKMIPQDFTNDQKLRAIADMLTDAGKKARYDLKTMMGVK